MWLKDRGKVEVLPFFEEGLLKVEAPSFDFTKLEIKGQKRLGLGIVETKKP
jgi:hypothetical protein